MEEKFVKVIAMKVHQEVYVAKMFQKLFVFHRQYVSKGSCDIYVEDGRRPTLLPKTQLLIDGWDSDCRSIDNWPHKKQF